MSIAVILPTYNERENIPLVIQSLTAALDGLDWEAIFVDDDSPDGTAQVVAKHARANPRIRLLHRIGQRGLASACVEGMLASQASFLVVMDADLQHDERVLPLMLSRLRQQSLDVVVATRNAQGGSMGQFALCRVLLSRAGRVLSRAVCGARLTDPMSGFFAVRRSFFLEVVDHLQGAGFKILVDLLASAQRPVRVGEVGYTFRPRSHGESKLDLLVGVEYLNMILGRLLGSVFPLAVLLYLIVGSAALLTHIVALQSFRYGLHLHLVAAQAWAATAAIALTFLLNNHLTFCSLRKRGAHLLTGVAQFALLCSIGVGVSELLATALCHSGVPCAFSATAGAVIGILWNLSVASQFTWRIPNPPPPAAEPYPRAIEASR